MKKRFLFTGFLLIVMLMASCIVALADDDVPPQDLISDNPNFSTYEWRRTIMPYASDKLEITRVVSSIIKNSSTSVYIRGVTEVNKQCSIVGAILYVEQWKDNKWNSYRTLSYTDYNCYAIDAENNITVDSGYYYRLVVQHRAITLGESADQVTYTKSLYVN